LDGSRNKAEIAKPFICPTIGGIGPLTIACLLQRNVNESAKVVLDVPSASYFRLRQLIKNNS